MPEDQAPSPTADSPAEGLFPAPSPPPPAALDMAVALDAGRLAGGRAAERQGRRFTAHEDDFAAAVNATLLVLHAAGLIRMPGRETAP